MHLRPYKTRGSLYMQVFPTVNGKAFDSPAKEGSTLSRMVSECLFFHGVKEPPKVIRQARKPSRTGVEPATESVDAFFHELFKRVGLSVEAYRSSALNRRIPACLRFLRVKDLDAARLKLEASPELATATASVVLLGVTVRL